MSGSRCEWYVKSATAKIRNTEPGNLAPQDADQRFPEGPFVGQIVRMISAAVFREFTRSYHNVTENHDIHRELYKNLDVQGYSNAGSRDHSASSSADQADDQAGRRQAVLASRPSLLMTQEMRNTTNDYIQVI